MDNSDEVWDLYLWVASSVNVGSVKSATPTGSSEYKRDSSATHLQLAQACPEDQGLSGRGDRLP